MQTGNLPALIVYTLDETIEDYTLGKNTRTQQRALNLIIEAHCRGTANIDDTLDIISYCQTHNIFKNYCDFLVNTLNRRRSNKQTSNFNFKELLQEFI